jgi:hypothetical protein
VKIREPFWPETLLRVFKLSGWEGVPRRSPRSDNVGESRPALAARDKVELPSIRTPRGKGATPTAHAGKDRKQRDPAQGASEGSRAASC